MSCLGSDICLWTSLVLPRPLSIYWSNVYWLSSVWWWWSMFWDDAQVRAGLTMTTMMLREEGIINFATSRSASLVSDVVDLLNDWSIPVAAVKDSILALLYIYSCWRNAFCSVQFQAFNLSPSHSKSKSERLVLCLCCRRFLSRQNAIFLFICSIQFPHCGLSFWNNPWHWLVAFRKITKCASLSQLGVKSFGSDCLWSWISAQHCVTPMIDGLFLCIGVPLSVA